MQTRDWLLLLAFVMIVVTNLLWSITLYTVQNDNAHAIGQNLQFTIDQSKRLNNQVLHLNACINEDTKPCALN